MTLVWISIVLLLILYALINKRLGELEKIEKEMRIQSKRLEIEQEIQESWIKNLQVRTEKLETPMAELGEGERHYKETIHTLQET